MKIIFKIIFQKNKKKVKNVKEKQKGSRVVERNKKKKTIAIIPSV